MTDEIRILLPLSEDEYVTYASQAERDRCIVLAEARHGLLFRTPWHGVAEGSRELVLRDARNWLRAAVIAGIVIPETAARHRALLRKHVRVTYGDGPGEHRDGTLVYATDDGEFCIRGDDGATMYGWPALDITEAPGA